MPTALVTGGSSGLGAAVVKRFATAAWEVWFTYRSGAERARELATACGEQVQAFYLDQGEWESCRRLVASLPSTPDVVILNAGLGSATVARYQEGTPAQDAALMQVNAVGPLWLCQQLLPRMRHRERGTLLFVASVSGGISPFAGFRHADAMGKAAVALLARQLAAELVHSGINVLAVCPGAMDTPMFEESTLQQLDKTEREALLRRLPKRRLLQPAEVAELVFVLGTSFPEILHGAVIDCSLGLGVHPGLLSRAEDV